MSELHYEKPGIIEAVFDVGVAADAAIALGDDGIAAVLAALPRYTRDRRNIEPIEFEASVTHGPPTSTATALRAHPKHVLVYHDQAQRAVQVGDRLAALNVLTPYGHFADYHDDLRALHAAWLSRRGPTKVARIGQRYLNLYQLPGDSSPADWFAIVPTPLSASGLAHREWRLHATVVATERVHVAVDLAYQGRQGTNDLWRLDVAAQGWPAEAADPEAWLAWQIMAHDSVGEAFECAITDALRERMGVRR